MSQPAHATISDLLKQGAARLSSSDSPQLDAELLLCAVLDKPRSYLHTWPENVPDKGSQNRFWELIERRAKDEPVAYILGKQDFWTLTLKVSPAVLIPRPETELLVETALQHIPEDADWNVADLGTGSGAITLAIATERPRCTVYASDISEQALEIARENASQLQIANVIFRQGHWLKPFTDMQFHLIVSNPPYIAEGDPHLEKAVFRYEPQQALTSGEDGLSDIEHIAQQAINHLTPGGLLMFEHGWQQALQVQKILEIHGYKDVETRYDLSGHERITFGKIKTGK